MRFKIAYCIYLVISLFYGIVPLIGPITIRHIFTIFMLIVCFFEGGLKLDKFLKWYLVFLFFYVLVEVASGYSSFMFNKLLGTYLASITLYIATKIMVEKYDAGFLIIMVLVTLGVVNSIVAIGQFYGSSIAQSIPEVLHVDITDKELELYDKEDLHGYNVGGLLGAVRSGYFLSATCVLALFSQKDRISIYNWAVFAIIFFALFLVQERSGLAAGSLCAILFLVIVSVRDRRSLVTSVSVLVVAIFVITQFGSRFVSFEDTRYASLGLEDEDRMRFAIDAIKWVLHNPMGGANYYYALGGYYPHNFFANAILYGGVFGGLVLIGIFIVQLVKITQATLSYFRDTHSSLLLVLCLAYLCYMINSFFHNYSLVTGGEMIFLLWAMIGSQFDIEDSNFEDLDDAEEDDYSNDTVMIVDTQ